VVGWSGDISIARQRATAEAREGFTAFFEKRSPAWMQ